MDLLDCYRLLGLRSGASFPDIKSSYRRLAQQYHPDINPDDERAKEKFIALTEAYKLLLQVIPPTEEKSKSYQKVSQPVETRQKQPTQTKETQQQRTRKVAKQQPKQQPKSKPKPPHVAEIERRLKWKTYEQLQTFLKERRFPQAIALAEALAERLPSDTEVRQWLAISYQLWGRALIAEKQLLKARIYLKKALKTDPKNKSLINEVQRDFKKLEQVF
ncbi:heat shock protein DnaJ domain-containing protein [Calothrix parasitica NIES-267]|uniref:Heat shock protein DnaJ domain-containing protein n=1 Tax=Calothrix parasitica NIES-267 TaxID=1973488 RepID=A0A1Z4LM56_9CYAN|nr:heat shock protein DnaJ domain-containing protein [Calothrix parasitica NIES-267]